MRIAVFGSTGRTGRLLCERALARGHEVTAHCRNAGKIADLDPAIRRVEGDLSDTAAIARALDGADVAVSALGTTSRKPNTVLSDATKAILAAMEQAGTRHFAAVTSLGCGDSYGQVNSRLMKLIIKTLAKEIWADKERQEEAIMRAGLDYLIVRPGGLTKGEASGEWTELRGGQRSKGKQMIARADVADYILTRCESLPFGNDTVMLV
ncbi:NAD(P)-dependent oxidoreductase [Erythrobacter sp.]|uniref:NAD(P)-dependent oxidoreductase n=1 Tax=Erythrobacter sp. TaxID=1042 RepID=UPI001425C908|nr:NAD(P)H-binding protein [Erythrobacter sp.]QIQ86598.1 MAG: NAD(P)H-binding protein [Erythrobacter sp.]